MGILYQECWRNMISILGLKIDLKDKWLLDKFHWYIATNGYVVAQEPGKNHKTRRKFYLQRLILDAPKDKQVDHINLDKLDNRRCNLRLATESQNKMNRRVQRNSKTGEKDITIQNVKSDSKLYRYFAVQIVRDGIRFRKYTNTLKKAIELRNQKIIDFHGKFARI